MTNPALSIVIPAFNEASRLRMTIADIDHFLNLQKFEAEVIIVNDGSTDETERTVNDMIAGKPRFRLISLPSNRGKGEAVKVGMMDASGEIRLFSDADLSAPIDELKNLAAALKPRGSADIAFGSRRVRGARLLRRQPLIREGSGRIFSLLVRLLMFPGYLDTQCGFKLFTADAAGKIFSKTLISGFGFDVEVLFIALKRFGMTVREVPVQWADSPQTRVRLIRDSIRMFGDLFRIRKNAKRGLYD